MDNKKYDVFISYSRQDYIKEDVVIPNNPITNIMDLFDKNNISYWIDKEGISSGQQFIEVITDAIANSMMLVFVSSANSNASKWVANEILEAYDKEKLIIPVRIDNSEYNKKYRIIVRPFDFIDYKKQPNTAMPKLLKAVKNKKEEIQKELQRLHPVKIDNFYGLADEDQNVVVKGTWLSIGQFQNSIAFAQSIDGKYGLINHFGQVVVPYQWTRIDDFYEGIAKVQGGNKKYGFVNFKGETISHCIWDSAEHFSEGLACVISAKESGFIDCTGEMAVPYNDGKMTSFSEGLACVSDKNGKWGYINKKGDLVIPYTWEKASPFHTGLARVIIKDLYGYINKKGQYEIPLDWSDSELIPVQDPETYLWGYVNSKGKVMIPFEWVSARPFSEGLARVEKNGVYGFIDRSGNLVIPRRFLEAGDFKDGYAEIKDCVETRCKYVDKDGNLL